MIVDINDIEALLSNLLLKNVISQSGPLMEKSTFLIQEKRLIVEDCF